MIDKVAEHEEKQTLYQECVKDVARQLKLYGEANAKARAWGFQHSLGIDREKLLEAARKQL